MFPGLAQSRTGRDVGTSILVRVALCHFHSSPLEGGHPRVIISAIVFG